MEKKFVVFDSELDYKGHMSVEHGKTMTKEQMKQTRKIDLKSVDASSEQEGSSSRTPVRSSRAPVGFGSRLTQKPPEGEADTSVRNSIEQLDISSPRPKSRQESWPTLSGNTQQQRQKNPPLNVTRIFDGLLDHKLLPLINTPAILAAEKAVAAKLTDVINNDANKWGTFKALCVNYVRGAILPERFYGEFQSLVCDEFLRKSFQLVSSIFPETMRNALLRVYNDKKVRENSFPELEAEFNKSLALLTYLYVIFFLPNLFECKQ
jgi:E3 ubiquitin-protein ligase ZNF598